MGNCLNTSRSSTAPKQQGRRPQVNPEEGLATSTARSSPTGGETSELAVQESSGLKVKIVLTRGELEWLMLQLKNGEKRLEDVLVEMGKEREREKARADGWKPSLESIVESPEIVCLD